MDVRNTGLDAGIKDEDDEIQKQKKKCFPMKRAKAKTMVDKCMNMAAQKGVRDVLSKDKPSDLFKDVIDPHDEKFVKEDCNQWVAHKFQQFKLEKNIRKIQNLIDAKQIQGPRFIMAQLRKYQLEKALFITDFEQGQDVLIPKSLSQEDLPLSYRYYDPIIMLI